jgi:hypothetical protein
VGRLSKNRRDAAAAVMDCIDRMIVPAKKIDCT